MGFLSLDDNHQASEPASSPVVLSTAQLQRSLDLFRLPSEDELFELRDLLPPGTDLHSGITATVALLVETQVEPVVLDSSPDELEDAISHLFSAHHNAHPADVPDIYFLDWQDEFRLCAVRLGISISFAPVALSALDPVSEEHAALRSQVADACKKVFSQPEENYVLHLVLRLRGGEPEPNLHGIDINYLLNRSADPASDTITTSRPAASEDEWPLVLGEPSSAFVESVEPSSVLAALHKCSEPKDRRVLSALKTTPGLYPDDAIVTGKWFRRVTFQAEGGSFVVSFKSKLRREPADFNVEGEVGFNQGPAATLRVGTAIRRRDNVQLRGDAALNKVLTDIRTFAKIRRWFLSCLIRGTILVDESSRFDGFIPEGIVRGKGRGVLLSRPMPMRYFADLGGVIASLGKTVIFKSYADDDLREVTQVSDDGVLIVGKRFKARPRQKGEEPAGSNIGYVWTEDHLEVGPKQEEDLAG